MSVAVGAALVLLPAWGAPIAAQDRTFLFREAVLSGFYSFDGVTGLPRGDNSKDRIEISPRPPGNYVGVDYVQTFSEESGVNRWLPDWLPVDALTLHPRVVWDRSEQSGGFRPLKFAPQDFWVRFNPGRIDRLTLRVGQFVIPYGANPVLAPRQRVQLPIEAVDLGLKWDWGVDLKGPVGDYDWEVAATVGNGVGLHAPRLFANEFRRSFLLSGRIGSPTYWDIQHGISFLAGDIPAIMGPRVLVGRSVSRWRVGYDVFWRNGIYLMAGAQLTYGQDGFSGRGMPTNVVGTRAWVDWVVPGHDDVRLSGQFESVHRDLVTAAFDDTDDIAAICEVRFSVATSMSVVMAYREEFRRSMGDLNDAFYLSLVYYAR